MSVRLERFPHTDFGNAERLVALHGHHLRAVGREWIVWDTRRFKRDATGEVMRRAKLTIRATRKAALAAQEQGEDVEALQKWVRRSESRKGLEDMIRVAQSDERVSIEMTQLDRDPWLFNAANGTIELKTGQLRPHAERDLITKISPVPLPLGESPGCRVFLKFLGTILNGDGELVEFMRRVLGYCLSGDVSEQALFVFLGDGANGKSTLLRVTRELLGEYGIQAAPRLLLEGNRHPTEVMDLKGVRAAIVVESEHGAAFGEAQVKHLTGGDPIKARAMRQDFVEFLPTHKLLLATNYRPQIRGTDVGIWRRIRVVPFDVVIAPEQQDPHLLDRIRPEYPAILQWALEGCLAWQRDGLGEPKAMKAATAAYRRDMDVIGTFVAEACERKADVMTPAATLHVAYQMWAADNDFEVENQRAFGLRLRKLGFEKRKDGVIKWVGIQLRTPLTRTS